MQLLSRRTFTGLVAAICATACLGFGSWAHRKSSEHGVEVTFANTMKFSDGNTLAAGTYRMEVPEKSQTPSVTFLQDGKVKATEQATVVTQQTKNSDTEVDSVTQGNEQAVTSIRPAGWEEKLVFGSGQ
jgi:hypothetical protein